MRYSKRLRVASLAVVLGLAAAACGSSAKTTSTTATTKGGTATTAATAGSTTAGSAAGATTAGSTAGGTSSGGTTFGGKLPDCFGNPTGTVTKGSKAGIAYDTGGRGDGTFNDSAARGADAAKTGLGVTIDELDAKTGDDRNPNLTTLSGNGDNPIIAVGFLFETDLVKIAAANPKTMYGIVDDVPPGANANVFSLVFAANEGSFLVGAAAALKSKSGHIGFIGGQDIDLIHNFEAGYDAGAKAVNPKITIESKYLGAAGDNAAWTSPDKAKEIATGWYTSGADVIYSAAGGSGNGTIDAAVAAGDGKWAIGVDSDQYLTATPAQQKHILTSMVKHVDVATYDTIRAVGQGATKGAVCTFSLANDGVGYATSGGYVDDIKTKLDGYKADIVSGKIVVPAK